MEHIADINAVALLLPQNYLFPFQLFCPFRSGSFNMDTIPVSSRSHKTTPTKEGNDVSIFNSYLDSLIGSRQRKKKE